MALFALFLSSFASGSSMLPAGIGMLGLCTGFILVVTPIISAAASALPPGQTGIGLGILQGAQFLGAGTGPALFGVLVAVRQQSGTAALNPLSTGHEGAAYSDAFLAMAAVTALALLAAHRMRPAAAAPTPTQAADKVRQGPQS
ncbi:hypothetical protein ABGB09_31375 [Streptomyces sp. B8F3]|uniref:hypothetical protein n=1 Tax=Streptomyces sp. B8F3 TaxID=3153573 RepID=UPI00325EBCE9